MSTEHNKQIIERCFRAYNEGTLDAIDDVAAPNFAYHDPGQPDIHSWPEQKAQLSSLRKALPDLRFVIEEMVAEEDRVAVRWTMHGTHQNVLYGVPATGRPIELKGQSLYHLCKGQVAAAYVVSDILGLRRQVTSNAQPV